LNFHTSQSLKTGGTINDLRKALYVVGDTKTAPVTTDVVLKKSQCEGAEREMDKWNYDTEKNFLC
jgi:hypothetical protein